MKFFKSADQHGVTEVLISNPYLRYETKTRVVGTEKRLFGLKKRDVIEEYSVPVGQYNMGQVLRNGSTEPASILYYAATDRDAFYTKGKAFYKDAGGRTGNTLSMWFLLPEGLSQKVVDEAKEDPRFARELVDGFVKEKYSEAFQKEWGAFARPPYKKWDEMGNKMFVGEKKFDGQKVLSGHKVVSLPKGFK